MKPKAITTQKVDAFYVEVTGITPRFSAALQILLFGRFMGLWNERVIRMNKNGYQISELVCNTKQPTW